jgi:hypothetical protein
MGDGLVGFHCPGCDEMHMVNTDVVDRPNHPAWDFDGNFDAPTFSPSINVTGVRRTTEDEYARIMAGERIDPTPRVCHSYVRAGAIQFFGDCTHALAGQTVQLKPFNTD